jgi:DNA polymerase elongation subunit (family B)
MNLTNIHASGRQIYLFTRDENGVLNIEQDNSFFPYYYEQSPEGNCLGYDGVPLKKLFVTHPGDVKERRTDFSYESDILYTKRYIIDKIKEIDKTKLRWFMIDIETLSKELPKPLEQKKASDPISCVVIYDNLTDKYYTWYLGDYKRESDMWFAFMNFIRDNAPDLLIAHNMNYFDFPYLHYRIPDFAKRISPIGQTRRGIQDIKFPAGISIVDSLEWWKKITLNKEPSYALDSLMEKYLGYDKGQYKNIDFSKLTPDIVGRCQGDVKGLVELEKKKKIIPHYDMIRRISHIEWEDMMWNSRIIDMFLLREAKADNIVLPMKPNGDNAEDDDFEGAFRDAFETGAFTQIGKYDLSGAYCYAITNLCLDSVNIVDQPTENSILIDVKDRATQAIVESYNVIQNPNALLPKVVFKLVNEKNKLKDLMNSTNPESEEYEDIEKKYNAFKTVVLSSWGVIGNKYFRRYDKRVASMTTGIVRDLLHYTFDELEKRGYKVIYIDTDSTFIKDNGENLEGLLNQIVNDWAQTRFGKSVDIKFDYEGHFEDLLILAKCRYIGYLKNKRGEIKEEIKGVEAKRKDSTTFMKGFQKTLIKKIFDIRKGEETQASIYGWILGQMEDIKNAPLQDIAMPCKLAMKPDKYKTLPIFARAMLETPGFTKEVGQNYYYIYVEPEYYEVPVETIEYFRIVPGKREGTTKKERLTKTKLRTQFGDYIHGKGSVEPEDYPFEEDIPKLKEAGLDWEIKKTMKKKARDVMAFDEEKQDHLRAIDWVRMIQRNITMKLDTLFNAMGWQDDLDKFKVGNVQIEEDE